MGASIAIYSANLIYDYYYKRGRSFYHRFSGWRSRYCRDLGLAFSVDSIASCRVHCVRLRWPEIAEKSTVPVTEGDADSTGANDPAATRSAGNRVDAGGCRDEFRTGNGQFVFEL